MLKETTPLDRIWLNARGSSRSVRAIISFIQFLERRFGAEFVYDQAHIGYESLDLTSLLELAEKLRACGAIRFCKRKSTLTDEPRIPYWYTEYDTGTGYKQSGGSSLDDRNALAKTLAEAIERHAWFNYEFDSLRSATIVEMEKSGNFLHPERFAGYSEPQRARNDRLTLKPTDQFNWIKGYSWTKERNSWVPAQIVSAHRKSRAFSQSSREPAIRMSITTGLATNPERINALLSGALEVIERDAYMITWLNQLTPPRINIDELALRDASFARLVARCRRYRLTPHILVLPTDAPAHAVCAVLEDMTGSLPRFSLGLKANRDPSLAAEGALLEALRARMGTREWKASSANDWDPQTKSTDIKQYDRLLYWTEEGRADRLAFLIQGAAQPLKKEVWENDTDEEHFARIVAWCREKGHELVSVSLSDAPANIPGWHIEFVVIPELQPLHYEERFPAIGGKRLKDIPKQFGYTPRKPYLDDPHPFA